MATSTLSPPPDVAAPVALATRTGVAVWPLYVVTFAVTSIVVGLIWDVSWHRTVGRDTLWTSAHLAIYLGAVLSGVVGAYYAFRTTFWGTGAEKAAGVGFWGFRAPLGAWIGVWGCIAMLTSAPFDEWWHSAYGLDVKIISPPHSLLAAGIFAVIAGALVLVLSAQNRAEGAERRRYALLFAYIAGTFVAGVVTFIFSQTGFPNLMRTSFFYQVTAIAIPFALIGPARASALRWPATLVAAISMLIILLMGWILPLFEGTPKLAPIYNPVTHMVPPPFPLLLVVPALGMDWLMQRTRIANDWLLAVLLGGVFVAAMLAAHWYWSEFLLSPAARNAFFFADRWDYNLGPGEWQYEYWNYGGDRPGGVLSVPLFLRGLAWAGLFAVVSSRIGLWWGNGMRSIRR